MKTSKFLITGSTGFIGKKFTDAISKIYTRDAEIITTSFTGSGKNNFKVNLIDPNEVRTLLSDIKPTHVFHFAAMVNPKANEESKLESFQKNFVITNNLINICDKETSFYFLSTDKVYNPANQQSSEDEVLEVPDNFYSVMKLVCEEIIRQRFERHFIFRCPIIHSTGETASNSFIDNAIMKLYGEQHIKAYTNVVRHYVLVDELVDFLISIVGSVQYGTFNLGSQSASYYDRIFSIALKNKLNTDLLSQDIGIVSPQVQLFNLTKFNKTFKKTFN